MSRTKSDESSFFSRLFADREAVLRTLSTLVSMLLVGVVVATIVVGYRPLKVRTSEVRSAPVSVVFYWPAVAGNPPQGQASSTWVNAEIRAELEKLSLGLLSSDPLDTLTLALTRDALLGTGWFNTDLRLTRDERNAVHIRGTWKVPVAAVRTASAGPNGMDQLVSAKGELLPPRYKHDASGMKVIVGVKNDQPKLGEPWLGGDVQAGLRLLEYLAVLPCFDQVTGVDVSEFSPGRRLVVITNLGNRILWGGSPDEFNPGQASPQTKLGRLAQLHREHGRIDAGRAMIDIRLSDGVYIQDVAGITTADPAETALPTPAAPVSAKKTAAGKTQRQASGNTRHR